ncbi:MAG: IPT/TIG domain-containing protein, partial [Blastocatellia bacterium]|nr:IPT/TIG domain-containing protein [Blastocatellia bacterium]
VRIKNRRGTATLANGFTYYVSGGSARTPVLGGISPASGSTSGGTVVTLTGANFTPETSVSFGDKAALATFINGNTLRAVTPAAMANGPVDVAVRNGDRQATRNAGFNYITATPPTVQVLSPVGGEKLYTGGQITIQWNSADDREVARHRIRFAYSPLPDIPSFEIFTDIATDVSGNTRSFTWMVPSWMQPVSSARIHVTAVDDEGAETDAVSGDFSIAQRWEAKAQLPLLAEGQYMADGKNFYVIGQTNFNTPPGFSVQRYDPAADAWTSEGLTPPPVAFVFASTATIVSGKIYLPGGYDSNFSYSQRHLVYDIAANTWSDRAAVPVFGTDYALAADEQRGVYYYIGGITSKDETFFDSSAEVMMYDPSSDTWTDLPPMNNDRFDASAIVIEGKLYVAGGYSDSGDPLAGEVYDFATRQWSPLAPLHSIRYQPANAVVKDAAGNPYWLFVGNISTTVALDAEAYDVRNNRWIQLDDSFTMPPVFDPTGMPAGR